MPAPGDMTPHMEDLLPPATLRLLRRAGEVAGREGYRLYVVGGTVRDLLLGRPVMDLDLLVQAGLALHPHRDALADMNAAFSLASTLAISLGGEVAGRSQFGTAKLRSQEMPLDLATARSEGYARPGALPTVRPGTVEDDLARRDFTVNAMAADLAPGRFGTLLDPHGGREDLARRALRPLHEGSFVDDATRILRAVRYEARLGLRMTPECEALARRDSPHLREISGDRVRNDLERILQEARPEGPLERASSLGALQAIHPSLAWTQDAGAAAQRLRESGQRVEPLAYLALLAADLAGSDAEGLVGRLNAPARWARVIRDALRTGERLPSISGDAVPPSRVYAALADLDPVAVLAWSCLAGPQAVRDRLAAFLGTLRHVAPVLRGPDLLALGVPQGPDVGRILQELRDARLDGILTSREDEERMVRSRLGQPSPSPAGKPPTHSGDEESR